MGIGGFMTLILLCIAVAISFTCGYILGSKEYAKENETLEDFIITLKTIDNSVNNLKKGEISKPVNLSKYKGERR